MPLGFCNTENLCATNLSPIFSVKQLPSSNNLCRWFIFFCKCFGENNRSKAALINAVHAATEHFENVFYFPAYELVIDDLRDYRFYAEDMVHPNYAATNYVWEKFITTCIDEPSQQLMKQINEINAAVNHKPFNATSEAHKKFVQINLNKIKALKKEYQYLDFTKEENFLKLNTPVPPLGGGGGS